MKVVLVLWIIGIYFVSRFMYNLKQCTLKKNFPVDKSAVFGKSNADLKVFDKKLWNTVFWIYILEFKVWNSHKVYSRTINSYNLQYYIYMSIYIKWLKTLILWHEILVLLHINNHHVNKTNGYRDYYWCIPQFIYKLVSLKSIS